MCLYTHKSDPNPAYLACNGEAILNDVQRLLVGELDHRLITILLGDLLANHSTN